MHTKIIGKSFILSKSLLIKNLLRQIYAITVVIGLTPTLAFSMEDQQPEERMGTLLSSHGININQEDEWPNPQIITLDVNENPYALRFKCDPSQRKFDLSLEKEDFGSVITNLLSVNTADVDVLSLEHTFVIKGQPHFIKFSIDPTFKVTLERISTPLHFYMTTTTPIVVQNGIDDQTFGIVESRGGSVFLGLRKDVMTGFQNPGDCRFNPTNSELSICAFSQFDNIYGGVYAPKGKILLATHDSISNGHGIETQVTTAFVSNSLNMTKNHAHKFYTGGNGSFMRSLSGMILNSKYITNFYNEIEVYGGDTILQGPPGSTIRITGNVKTSGGMWIMANHYDLRQERECVLTQSSAVIGGTLRLGEVSLSHGYPYVKMSGDHNLRCDYVHLNHPSGGWQPHIADVPCGREFSSDYNGNGGQYNRPGGMFIKVHTGVTRVLNLDTGQYIYIT